MLGKGVVARGFEKHHQWAADALLERNRCDGAHIVGQALSDVIGQLLGAGEEDVAGLAGDCLAPEQARKVGAGENAAKMLYGFVRPMLRVPDMFSGQL